MKITEVESFLMSYVMPRPILLPFWGGTRSIIKRDAMLIRLRTDTGLTGYAPGPAHERAAAEIRARIRAFLLGKNPLDWQSFDFSAGPQTRMTYRAVEIALMDLAARHEGCPLSELLGGRQRDRIQLYGSAGMYMAPELFAEEAAAVADLGFPAYKMRPALGPDRDLETIERMRQAVGPDFGLMIDAHSWWRMGVRSYSFETVADLSRSMAAFHPLWIEEPLPPDDHAAYRRLRALGHAPVATGEHEPTEAGFQDLIDTGAADYLQMDVCCQGGFEMGRRVMDAIERAGLKFAFHSWGTSLEVLAAAHLGICRSADVVEWLEHPCYANQGRPGMYPFPLADEILKSPLPIEKGHLVVPDAPGLGIDIDESVIDRYPFQPGPWSYFQIDSPPETVAVTGDHSVKWVTGPDIDLNDNHRLSRSN